MLMVGVLTLPQAVSTLIVATRHLLQVPVVGDATEELFGQKRFVEEIVGAVFDELGGEIFIVAAGNADDGETFLVILAPQTRIQVEAAHAGHFMIGNNQPDVRVFVHHLQRHVAAVGLLDAELVALEKAGAFELCSQAVMGTT
jgi:hypothetical protein